MNPYESPCIRECVLDMETRVCRGCGRTLHEIERWVDFTDEERAAVNERLKDRPPPGE